jgi:hypothetical protein
MKCLKTNKECEHNCISNSGGYAGDDCYIKDKRIGVVEDIGAGLIIVIGIGGTIFFILKMCNIL